MDISSHQTQLGAPADVTTALRQSTARLKSLYAGSARVLAYDAKACYSSQYSYATLSLSLVFSAIAEFSDGGIVVGGVRDNKYMHTHSAMLAACIDPCTSPRDAAANRRKRGLA